MRLSTLIKGVVSLGLAVVMAAILAAPLRAQYYGRNKVQYEKFDFKIMKTRHFDIYFYMQDEETVRLAGLMAERWYSRLARMFNYEMRGRQPLVLYASGPEFQQNTIIPGTMGEGTGGVTESFKRRIVLPYGASLVETDHVIGHELVHAFQYDIMAQGRPAGGAYAAEMEMRIPLWFIEGMAEYLSIGSVDPNTAMWMRDAVRRKDLPSLRKLDNYYKYFPYRWGQAFWAYVTGRWGDEVIGKLMKATGRSGDYEVILEGMLGVKVKQLAADWHKAMQDAYLPLLDKTQTADKIGKTVFKGTENSIYNIAPAVSPDGRQVVMLSSRDLFSVDMYLAETDTGRITDKLISTAVDPHFESIEFIRSSGSWDAKGEKFVFGSVAKGRPLLAIMDMKKRKVVREIPFPELGEILTPCWSPDDRYVAFSALSGGVTDIFIYDLQTNVLKQMTKDVYGDIHPAWSPDGKKIAFSTERFSANLNWVDVGNYELALMDVETGQIQKVLAFPNGKNIDPKWTEDSQGLYFVSDQNGKSDLYRIELATGKIFQITNLYAGISGITDISPAISLSPQTGRIVFSAYDGSYYSIFSVDDKTVLQGQSFLAQFERNPAILPPRALPEGALLGLLRNPLFGLPKDTNFAVTSYKPKLGLDYITPPTIAVGVDRYGTYGAGGISAYWSDMLGYHTVITTAITGPQFVDTSGILAYLNSRNRLNWGFAAQRIVYPYPYFLIYEDPTGQEIGEPAIVQAEDIFRIINYDVSAFGIYPLDSVRRVEFSLGYRYLGFSETIYKDYYSLLDGSFIYHTKVKGPKYPGMGYGYVTAGYYYDTGIFGATSPILGMNYGVSVSPAVGQITFTTLALDVRKYFMPIRPVTLAFRALHLGRYGKNAEDDRFYPLYIAYWDLVRGYESFTSEEQTRAAEMGRTPFDYNRLFGSRIIVGNVEIRFPLLGILGIGKGYFGAWPLEFYGFYDWGIAYASNPNQWWGGTTANDVKPWFLGGNRHPISSTGIGIRTNLFGALVLGLNYVYPISRPERGWHFQLSLSPGF